MFNRPILVYSDYCNHCNNFIQALIKHPDIFESFIRLNIDVAPRTRQRPKAFTDIQVALNQKITNVPTIVVENGEYVLSGEEAFKWLQYKTTENQPQTLEAFNPNEMGSFSDSYAKYGSTKLHDATEQSFKFVNKPDPSIATPQEDDHAVTHDEYTRKEKERETFNNVQSSFEKSAKMDFHQQQTPNKINEQDYSHMLQNRNMSSNPGMPRMNHGIDFTGTDNGFYNNNNNSNISQKQKDIDMKLQQLLSERDSNSSRQNTRPTKVDFKTGKVLE